MTRNYEMRQRLTLSLFVASLAMAVMSVPAPAKVALAPVGEPLGAPRYAATSKIYLEILTCPSDDDRSGVPLTYVNCTSAESYNFDSEPNDAPAPPTDTIVFPN